MSGPLDGIRIIDMTMFVSGPSCTQLLASMGADVIKVERPPSGDVYRVQGPEFIEDQSISFLALNKGKRSLVLDMKTAQGKAIMHQLLETADVFVHNFKPDTAERLGLAREELSERYPGLIWTALSGYGGVGPRGIDGGYDLVAQGELGLMDATGSADRPPAKAGFAVIDIHAGALLALAIVSALLTRSRTGDVRDVETSLFEVASSFGAITAERYFATGILPKRLGSASSLFSPYEAYKTADGYVTVGATGPPNAFTEFCKAIGEPDLATRPEYATNAERVAHQNSLREEVEKKTTQRRTEEWVRIFTDLGMPAGPIQSIGAGLTSPQAHALGVVVDTDHPTIGSYKSLRTPLRFHPPLDKVHGAPLLGEHTREILSELGHGSLDIAALEETGVVIANPSDDTGLS